MDELYIVEDHNAETEWYNFIEQVKKWALPALRAGGRTVINTRRLNPAQRHAAAMILSDSAFYVEVYANSIHLSTTPNIAV